MNTERQLVFYTCTDQKGKHDATGAFIPEALAYGDFYRIPEENLVPIDCKGSTDKRREEVLAEIRCRKNLSAVVFFCHGTTKGIQFGFDLWNADILAKALHTALSPGGRVVFYCCSVARGMNVPRPKSVRETMNSFRVVGGFCDTLFGELSDLSLGNCSRIPKIYGHYTPGHTTWNPYVVEFDYWTMMWWGRQGKYVIDPVSDDDWPAWRKALKGDMRFKFPWMDEGKIRRELRGA